MKQNPIEPNAGKNISSSFHVLLERTDATSDKICDPNPLRQFWPVKDVSRLGVCGNEKLSKSRRFFLGQTAFHEAISAGKSGSRNRC
jgi:hypothetical protein